MGPGYGAFVGLVPGSPLTATVMGRAVLAAQYLEADAEGRQRIREQMVGLSDQPAAIQAALVEGRLERMQRYLGSSDGTVRAVLGGRSASAVAASIAGSQLSTAAGTEALLEAGDAAIAADPAVVAARAFMPALTQFQQAQAASNAEIAALSARLARARFELYGTSIPPDATFTLRISDGVVRGYPYNGTEAPPYTTFYGMYDRYQSHCVRTGRTGTDCPWYLPPNWLEAEDNLDLSTPYNFVSTNDIIGGNSGSPMLNRDLEVVGIAFDGNIQSLPGHYIFDDTLNRTVSVDVRAMLEVLEEVYDMDWVAEELRRAKE
jgi:hypothetical protein